MNELMPMLRTLERASKELMRGQPGQRFQSQYHRRRKSPQSGLRKGIFIGSGLVLLAAGMFLLAVPGPGILVVALGGALVAQESLLTARALDASEVQLRRVAAQGWRLWQGASVLVRFTLVMAGIVLVAGFLGVALWLLFFQTH